MRREEQKRRRGCRSKESGGMFIILRLEFCLATEISFPSHEEQERRDGSLVEGEKESMERRAEKEREMESRQRQRRARKSFFVVQERERRKEEKKGGKGRSSAREGNGRSLPQEARKTLEMGGAERREGKEKRKEKKGDPYREREMGDGRRREKGKKGVALLLPYMRTRGRGEEEDLCFS